MIGRRRRRSGGTGASTARPNGGQSLVEMAVILPVLLIVLLGLVEFGNALAISHAMTGYSREGANIAARGTSLDTVVAVLAAQGQEIDLEARGGVIASRLQVENGLPVVKEQVASPGWTNQTRVAAVDSVAHSFSGSGLLEGQSYWVVEVLYVYEPLGPVAPALGPLLPTVLYRWSLF